MVPSPWGSVVLRRRVRMCSYEFELPVFGQADRPSSLMCIRAPGKASCQNADSGAQDCAQTAESGAHTCSARTT
eukprot:5072877-Prymnesium_polylepis.1